MDRALFAAATGMAAQQANLDTIASNLANADVTGFKGAENEFAALAAPGEPGAGTIAIGTHPVFTQGKLERSNGPFDVAIEGSGFFVLANGSQRAYTRCGEFSRAADGSLQNERGWHLLGVRIPSDALSAMVAVDGTVSVTTPQGTKSIAHLQLALFLAPEHLRGNGGTIFTQTAASGSPHMIRPGGSGGPALRFGMLERSNVSLVEAMMQILTAQRAYEANAKGVQAADEMLRIANNLQRG
jgi:flagellar basal-body rod protein FlgG